MRHMFTLQPFIVALVVGIAAMGLDIYEINAWHVGTLKVEPWRQKTSGAIRRITSFFSWCLSWVCSPKFAIGCALALAVLAVQLSASSPEGVALAIVGAGGTVDLAEVKKALDDANALFEGQFKDINGKIKALEAKGQAVDPLLDEQRKKLNEAIENLTQLNDHYIKQQTVINRLEKMGLPHGGMNDAERRAIETRAFNIARTDIAQAKGQAGPAPITEEAYESYRKAFDRYLVVGEKGLSVDEARAMSVGNDLAGGFLVTPDKTGALVKKIFETSDMRRFASIQAISTDALEGSADLDEGSGGWVGETGSRAETNTPNVPTPWKIPVHELYANPKATQKLINDSSISVADWLMGKVSDKLTRLQNTAFVTGNGVAKPRGFASYTTAATADASRAWGVFEHIASGSAGAWGTDPNAIQKLNLLMGALKDAYVANAQFFCNRTTKFSIRNLTDASSAGKFVFIPSFQAGVPDVVLGAPLNVFQDMATYTTTDALALAYGDMRATYQIVDRQGISVLVDPYTAKPYVHYYTTARVGGDAIHFEAMKFLKFGTS